MHSLMEYAVEEQGYDPQFLISLFRRIAICALQMDDLGIALAISLMPEELGDFVLETLVETE